MSLKGRRFRGMRGGIASLVLMSACAAAVLPAQRGTPRLEELGRAWAGPSASQQCVTFAPRRFDPPNPERCDWTALPDGRLGTQLWGKRPSGGALESLFWMRVTLDSADAQRVIDSLSTALVRRGLAGFPCEYGGHRWQAPGLGVEVALARDTLSPRQRVRVFATIEPNGLPDTFCKNVPAVPRARLIPRRIGVVDRPSDREVSAQVPPALLTPVAADGAADVL